MICSDVFLTNFQVYWCCGQTQSRLFDLSAKSKLWRKGKKQNRTIYAMLRSEIQTPSGLLLPFFNLMNYK